MKKSFITVFALVILAGLGYGVYAIRVSPEHISAQAGATAVPALAQEYANTRYGFRLTMPADFTTVSIPDESSGGETILLQNKDGDGIQIVITPFDEDTGSGYTLTRERILQDIPDMQIQDEQVIEVGDNYKGIAFTADSETFGEASRAVWFVFRGNLYQINTYARLDELLKKMFSTWTFF